MALAVQKLREEQTNLFNGLLKVAIVALTVGLNSKISIKKSLTVYQSGFTAKAKLQKNLLKFNHIAGGLKTTFKNIKIGIQFLLLLQVPCNFSRKKLPLFRSPSVTFSFSNVNFFQKRLIRFINNLKLAVFVVC